MRLNVFTYASMLLILASFALALVAMYVLEVFSFSYGLGVGAILQARSNLNATIAAPLYYDVQNLPFLHRSIYESYILLAIATIALLSAMIIYTNRANRFSAIIHRYSLLHLVMSLLFIALFFIALSETNITIGGLYGYVIYLAMIIAVAIDLYFEISLHLRTRTKSGMRTNLGIEPTKPFTNIVRLRDEVFSRLSGYVRIIDKNINSDAIENLHRLLENNSTIKEVSIITTAMSLDSSFNKNYNDFKEELGNRGIAVSLMLMADQDAVAQHERIIFDEKNAFKIPPLNIINKKSEHITRIKLSDARKRYEELAKGSIKYENYLIKLNKESQQ